MENLKENIAELYERYLTHYGDANVMASNIAEQFVSSEQYQDFRKVVLSLLTKGLQNGLVTANEYDEILNEFSITATETELNEIMSEDRKPMPSTTPPEGQRWAWDADAKDWVLVQAG
jgi:phosphoglycolate phosphatase-like HAD superfamily hydrolase